jgi:hypothetical protein
MKVDLALRLKREHSEWCFARAFPKSRVERCQAEDALELVEQRTRLLSKSQRRSLEDSGQAGTLLRYSFSFEVAKWLARTSPGAVSIDWEALQNTERLDELLRLLLQPSEDEYFDSGAVTTQEWVTVASSGFQGTDFDWLMAQLGGKRLEPVWRQLYDAADIPLVWDLSGSRYSKSLNVYPVAQISARQDGMRSRPQHVKREIQRPVKSVSSLSRADGARMIDVAMASLAARHRETYHFNFANPEEVYLADVGKGVSVAVFGLLPGHRFPLECTMGYLILANGAPVGYGGSSILFRQVNTGVNIFDEYRGSEASYLWVQVMRVYHSLVGCTRYIANPYQFGEGNREALQSGAFWFYYKLGYRPVLPDIRALAKSELEKKQQDPRYRSGTRTLRKLASCDMHLCLSGARQSEFFEEEWITTSSELATEVLGSAGGRTRRAAADRVTSSLARDVGIRSLRTWSSDEKRSCSALAPIAAAAKPGTWDREAKQKLRELLRAKGSERELDYARHLCAHDQFLRSLRAVCRDTQRRER